MGVEDSRAKPRRDQSPLTTFRTDIILHLFAPSPSPSPSSSSILPSSTLYPFLLSISRITLSIPRWSIPVLPFQTPRSPDQWIRQHLSSRLATSASTKKSGPGVAPAIPSWRVKSWTSTRGWPTICRGYRFCFVMTLLSPLFARTLRIWRSCICPAHAPRCWKTVRSRLLCMIDWLRSVWGQFEVDSSMISLYLFLSFSLSLFRSIPMWLGGLPTMEDEDVMVALFCFTSSLLLLSLRNTVPGKRVVGDGEAILIFFLRDSGEPNRPSFILSHFSIPQPPITSNKFLRT